MRKRRQIELDVAPPLRAEKTPSARARKSSTPRRRLLLLDYEKWVTVTDKAAESAANRA